MAKNSGFYGQLHVVEFAGMRAQDVALPADAQLQHVIAGVAWRSNTELVCACRTGDRTDKDPPLTCQGQVVSVTLGEKPALRVRYSGRLLPWQGGVAAHPSGAVVVHEITPGSKSTGSLKLIAADDTVSTLVEGGFNGSPRFARRDDGQMVLRWYAEQPATGDATWTAISAEMPFTNDGAPVTDARDDLRVPAPANVVPKYDLLRGLLTGTARTLWIAGKRGGFVGDDWPIRFDGTQADSQELLVYNGGSSRQFQPVAKGIVNLVNTTCPDKYALLAAAREFCGLTNVADSVLLFDVKIHDTDENGQTKVREGTYQEFVRGDHIRIEERYGDAAITSWDGEKVGHQSGNGAFESYAPGAGVNSGTAREQLEELRVRLRLRNLFLLQSVDKPDNGEQPDRFRFNVHGQVSVALGGSFGAGKQPLVYVRRVSARRTGENEGAEEFSFIGFRVLNAGVKDSPARVEPREVRTLSGWLRATANEEDENGVTLEKKVAASVIRFGEFVAYKSNAAHPVKLPGSIRLYNVDRHTAEDPHIALSEGARLALEARLQGGMEYTLSDRNRKRQFTGINWGLPDACFKSLNW